MLKFIEVTHIPASIQRPTSPPEHPRLVLEEFSVGEKRVDELVEEDGRTEEEIEEGQERDSEAKVIDQLKLVGSWFILFSEVEAVLEGSFETGPFVARGGRRGGREEEGGRRKENYLIARLVDTMPKNI